jgi:fluoride exporter
LNILLVMTGGALGAMFRYGIGLYFMKKIPHPPIPMAMLVVNVIGSTGLGLFLGKYFSNYEPTVLYEAPIFLFVGLGFFGAFTTFSTFSIETILLLREGKLRKAVLYMFLTMLLSISFFSLAVLLTEG